MIEYCKKWILGQARAAGLLSEEAAFGLHASRQPYWALIGASASPTEAISLDGGDVAVYFLDEDRRPHFLYSFEEVSEGRLFLSQIMFYEYDDGGARPTRTVVMKFSPDGTMDISEMDKKKGELVEKSGKVNASSHWEEYPAFGDYRGVLRRERDRSVE